MATDIVPELYEKIQADFENRVNRNKEIQNFYRKLKKGTASAEAVSQYARHLGECASKAFEDNISEDVLPEGKMYWNIAERIVKPLIVIIYDRVNEAASKVQAIEDKRAGMNIKSVKAPFPEDRVNALLNRMVEATNG